MIPTVQIGTRIQSKSKLDRNLFLFVMQNSIPINVRLFSSDHVSLIYELESSFFSNIRPLVDELCTDVMQAEVGHKPR